MPEKDRKTIASKAQNVAGFTVFILVVLGIIQIILGETISKSVALTANGIDCIGDGFVSGIVWVGLRFFRKPADHKFHYGYYKFENLAAIAAAIVMIVLAIFIGYRSYLQLTDPHEIKVPILGATVALIAALIAWGLGIKKYFEGKQSNLSSVKLDAINTIKDGTASFLAVIALVLSSYGYPVADAVVGFIIGGIILSIGFATIKESSYILVDACDTECMEQGQVIRGLADKIEGVGFAHVVRLRRSGPIIQGEVEIHVPADMSIAEVDKIRSEINRLAKERVPDIERLTVVALPQKKE
ncbi:MAG: cation transporter [Methanomassiliicoccales archaeon]|nr:MAG: cation transporter [Methanomassiliicoccales archaeon]